MCFISKSISKINLIRRYYHYSHFINEIKGGGQRKFIMSTNLQIKNTAPRFEPQVWLQRPCSYPLPSATLQYVYQVWHVPSGPQTVTPPLAGFLPPKDRIKQKLDLQPFNEKDAVYEVYIRNADQDS